MNCYKRKFWKNRKAEMIDFLDFDAAAIGQMFENGQKK
jgi:hypothetical protein